MPPTRRTRNVPERSGDRFVEPPVRPTAERPAASIETLLDNNRLLRAAVDTRFGDLKFWELVAATRREVLTVAAEYTQSYRDAERPSDTADWIARPIIMGGHQPELFHPGVWLKNSTLDAYARAVSGTAINLVVDTDRCVRASVGVPVGSPREAHVEEVPFDARAPEMAWEERPIVDRDLFASFGARGSALIAPLEPHPILRRWWPLAQERAAECHRLGLALSQARHALESRFGWETLEVPVSELVRLPTVMVFMGWLLAHARQFHDAYNTALSGYRRSHRVRGRGRPMPDLATRVDSSGEGPWFELPWWIWSRDDPRRRRVFADVSQPGALTLSDLETVRVELPIAPETSPAKWVDALSRLEEHALRLRPRAIVTTMLARLMIADVFVHGVGGAAYDQLTDSIVRQLTGCDPPRFAVVSGTLRLPCAAALPELAADPRVELAEVQQLLRDLEFHPERHLLPLGERSAEVRDLVRSKRHWIDTPATVTLSRRRCHEIRAANERLRSEVAGLRRAALERIGPLAARIRARDVLRSREYPWCFFAENSLRSFLLLEND